MPEEPLPVRAGQLIGGRYRVESVLGHGAMTVVVAARHEQVDELVAIKFLRERVSTPERRERFAGEARAAVKIKSEHVARVTDVDALPDGTPYVVIDHIEGE